MANPLVPVSQLVAPTPAPAKTPSPLITPDQHLSDLETRMGKMEAEGRVLSKVGGVGTDDYNKLVKQHGELRRQQRFLQRAYPKTGGASIDEHPVAALDRLRQEGEA